MWYVRTKVPWYREWYQWYQWYHGTRGVRTRVPWCECYYYQPDYYYYYIMEKGTHVHREPRVFWEETGQPVERGSECRAIHTKPLATALTPLPQRRGLPRESPRTCTHAYVRAYVRTMVRTMVPWYVRSTYTCTYTNSGIVNM